MLRVTGHGYLCRPPVQIMRTGLGGRHAEFRPTATRGRVTDRFCLSERTSPSKEFSQPIHIGSSARGVGDGAGAGLVADGVELVSHPWPAKYFCGLPRATGPAVS